MMTIYKFQAELEIIGINPFVALPIDILQQVNFYRFRPKKIAHCYLWSG